MDENTPSVESGFQPSTETSAVETVIDYSDQFQIIIHQQQLSICVCAILLGVLIVTSIFNVFSRYL